MIHASSVVSADDISIRCRVKRSQFATQTPASDVMEMTCTMRNWHPQNNQSVSYSKSTSTMSHSTRCTISSAATDTQHVGPELVLHHVKEFLSTTSLGRSPSPLRVKHRVSPMAVPPSKASMRIPLVEIMIVETRNLRRRTSCNKINIATLSDGYFEFDCITNNSHDMLLAFLQASLPKERILENVDDDPALHLQKSHSSVSQMDVDRLTAQKIQGMAEHETFSEKISRRVTRAVRSLSEISGNICDFACCRGREEVRDMPPSHLNKKSLENQNSLSAHDLEMDDDEISITLKKKNEADHPGKYNLPSGLSVESDPALE